MASLWVAVPPHKPAIRRATQFHDTSTSGLSAKQEPRTRAAMLGRSPNAIRRPEYKVISKTIQQTDVTTP